MRFARTFFASVVGCGLAAVAVACSSEATPAPAPVIPDSAVVRTDSTQGFDFAFLNEAAARYVAGINARSSRCNPENIHLSYADVTPASYWVELLSAPGTTQEMRFAFDSCARTLAVSECSAGMNQPECLLFFGMTGTLPLEAPCLNGNQCASGACNAPLSKRSCGQCVPAFGEGANCGGIDTLRCGAGLRCSISKNDELLCVSNAPKQLGQACFSTNQCDSGLYCDESASVCRGVSQAGQSCVAAHNSVAAVCNPGGTYGCSPSTNTCERRPAEGEPCNYRDRTPNGPLRCQGGLVCDADKRTCRKPLTGVALGMPCEAEDLCTAGSSCWGSVPTPDGGTGSNTVCRKHLQVGETCFTDFMTGECERGSLACDTVTRKCVAVLSPQSCASPFTL